MSKDFKTVVPFSPAALKTQEDIDYLISFCKETDIYGIWLVDDFYVETNEGRAERARWLAEILKNAGVNIMGCWFKPFLQDRQKSVGNSILRLK